MSLKSASVGPNKQSVEVVRKLKTKQQKMKLCDKLITGSLHEKPAHPTWPPQNQLIFMSNNFHIFNETMQTFIIILWVFPELQAPKVHRVG